MLFRRFVVGSVRQMITGGRGYFAWLAFLGLCIVIGLLGYVEQIRGGLIHTHMRDPVSWGFYIGNFTFLVGVAAAAVVLVIPAYIFQW
jgi:molybdopterin-containing oxidoreductase family membrane subunit